MLVQSLPPAPPKRGPLKVQRAVLLALVIRELRTRVQGRWLGMLWMLFEPLAHVLLILAVFGFRHHAASVNVEFPVFLVTGLLPFFIFRNLARRLPNAISSNRSLFSYRQVKPIDALIARVIVETGLYSAVYLTALVLLGWLGFHWLPWAPLELMAVSFVLVVFGAVAGLLFSVLAHNRPKVQTVIGWIFLPLYVASGVIFPLQSLPLEYRHWLMFNPLLHLVELSRTYFIPNYESLPGVNLGYPAAWTLGVATLALSAYRLYRYHMVAAE
ncbi:ABC transporter permease [Piscinibacter sp.]|uniref:ABC transporter permease n=1 Tax=Piscinibacter sp. TaxID=1903157 RepID=UPI002CB116B9|nr:ABC transporter permease [Albitalea sp.]HUG21243.1 ABC transporter permease [Albitalea sp.]